LVLVLLLLAAAATLTVAAVFRSRTSAFVARSYAVAAQLSAGLEAGVQWASYVLAQDLETNDFDSFEDAWAEEDSAFRLGDVLVEVRIEDECAKICLGTFSEKGIEFPNMERDADQPRRPVGSRLRPLRRDPAKAKPDQWEWLERLHQGGHFEFLENVDKDSIAATLDETNVSLNELLGYVTFWTDGRLNLNTAAREVLQAAFDSGNRIYNKARDFPFEDLEEAAKAAGVSGRQAVDLARRGRVASDTFSIHVTARRASAARTGLYVVRRTRTGIVLLCRVY